MSTSESGHSTIEGPQDFWFINSLVTFVVDAAVTEGAFSLFRQVAPSGFATPYHTHAAYGEGFYIIEGEVTFVCDRKKTVLGSGGLSICRACSHMVFASVDPVRRS